jgi:hypothetical protein
VLRERESIQEAVRRFRKIGKPPPEHVLLAVVPWVRPTTKPKEVRHGRVEQVETGGNT